MLHAQDFLVVEERLCGAGGGDCGTQSDRIGLSCGTKNHKLTCAYGEFVVGEWCRANGCAVCAPAVLSPIDLPVRNPRIFLFIPFFGSPLNYFQLYLDSLGRNADVLTVFFLTDTDLSAYRLPSNLIVIPLTMTLLRRKLADVIRLDNATITFPSSFFSGAYKLVDFKPLFTKVFEDVLQVHRVRENDFVGFGDCDLIYGRLADLWRKEHHNLDIIGGYHGHFVAWKNTHEFRNLYRGVPKLHEILLDTRVHIMDEIAFRPSLLQYLEKSQKKMFYINSVFLDIVPPMFYHMFRADHKERKKNFFDVYHAHTDIDSIYCSTMSGRIRVKFDDNSSMDCAYVHLQKRPMQITWEKDPRHGYYITDRSFNSGDIA
jgi:hypothetical protein